MKKVIFTLALSLFVLPLAAGAHGSMMMGSGDAQMGSDMMRQIEDQILGDEVHEEMEALMIKMMSGESLAEEEVGQLITFMDENPGPHAMMMNRISSMGHKYSRGTHTHSSYDHHGSFGFGSNLGWMGGVTHVLFWIVLILAGVGLFRWTKNK